MYVRSTVKELSSTVDAKKIMKVQLMANLGYYPLSDTKHEKKTFFARESEVNPIEVFVLPNQLTYLILMRIGASI